VKYEKVFFVPKTGISQEDELEGASELKANYEKQPRGLMQRQWEDWNAASIQ
jgi:hypothetical protein